MPERAVLVEISENPATIATGPGGTGRTDVSRSWTRPTFTNRKPGIVGSSGLPPAGITPRAPGPGAFWTYSQSAGLQTLGSRPETTEKFFASSSFISTIALGLVAMNALAWNESPSRRRRAFTKRCAAGAPGRIRV